ncbi:hypothetical protein F5141DRAFT_1063298 [Pisolithus sp. B1]|nr:hypothetical protein F5141DRAFT_1063298 [Pisolithus sp. B1]
MVDWLRRRWMRLADGKIVRLECTRPSRMHQVQALLRGVLRPHLLNQLLIKTQALAIDATGVIMRFQPIFHVMPSGEMIPPNEVLQGSGGGQDSGGTCSCCETLPRREHGLPSGKRLDLTFCGGVFPRFRFGQRSAAILAPVWIVSSAPVLDIVQLGMANPARKRCKITGRFYLQQIDMAAENRPENDENHTSQTKIARLRRDAGCDHVPMPTHDARPKTLNVDVFLTSSMSIDPSKTTQHNTGRHVLLRYGLTGLHEYQR